MEAMSSASAYSLAGVLRTFSGASARQLSGISRMSGSGGGAMWFMRVSMDERIGGANAALSGRHASVRAGLGSASGCCSCVSRMSGAGRPAPSPEGSSGASSETGAAARQAVSGGGSTRSTASSRSLAALAERIRRVPHAAGANEGFGPEIGVGSPRYPERESGQGFERLPQRLGGGAVDRADHGEVLRSGAMSMRSPQGSRFHSEGGLE